MQLAAWKILPKRANPRGKAAAFRQGPRNGHAVDFIGDAGRISRAGGLRLENPLPLFSCVDDVARARGAGSHRGGLRGIKKGRTACFRSALPRFL